MTAITARQRWQRAYSDARYERWPNNVDPVQMAAFRLRYPLFRFFGPAFGRAFSAAFDRNIASAAVPWYLAGNAPTPIAVYEPKGKATLVASYVNLVNPGTYDAAPGVAPTFDTATGWSFNGFSQYLTTGIALGSMPGVAALIKFSNASPSGSAQTLFGLYDSVAPYGFCLVQLNGVASMRSFDGGAANFADNAPVMSSGVYAVANLTAYRNGLAETNLIPSSTASTPNQTLFIGALSINGSPSQYSICKVQAFVAWSTSTDHATWMPAVMAACALI